MKKNTKNDDADKWKTSVGNTLEIQVTPKSSSNRVRAEIINGEWRIKVYVTAAPENDKANKAIIDLLAKELDVPRSSLTIISGHKGRKKVIAKL
jgi:uncharacterized protein